MRLNALLETDLSRRQFLKLGGKAAMAAAAPSSVLKGLTSTPSAPANIMMSVQPDLHTLDLATIMSNVLSLTKIAKNIGSGPVAGADLDNGFEVFTAGNLDNIKQLISSGTLTAVNDWSDFGRQITNTDIQRAKYKIKKEYQSLVDNGRLVSVWADKQNFEDFEARRLAHFIDNWKETTSTIQLFDKHDNMYTVSTLDSTYATDPKNVLAHTNDDPITSLWCDHLKHVMDELEFSKPALDIIKHKELYKDLHSPFALRKIIDEFNRFGVSLPTGISKEITKFNNSTWATERGIKFDDIKPGENDTDFENRKKDEQQKQQKKEFDEAPPTQFEPDAWKSNTTEFESKLNRILAFDDQNSKCPQCNKMMVVLPNEPFECSCGWKKDPAPPSGTNHQFGQRFSELARMIPPRTMPGINGGRVS